MINYKNVFATILLSMILFSCGAKDEKPVPEGYTRGIVTETMNSGGYTYMLLDQDGEKVWIAATEMEISVDDTVYYQVAMEMKDFHSNSMHRDFERIIFTDNCTKNPWEEVSAHQQMMEMGGDENPHEKLSYEKVRGISVEPVKGGYSIENIYKEKDSFAGKTLKVKGQVVKFNSGIMGTNWAHLQDGTGNNNDYDIAVTTDETVNVGDIVVFEGVLAVDKDFGSGYKFPVIIEKASLIKQMSGI